MSEGPVFYALPQKKTEKSKPVFYALPTENRMWEDRI